MANEFAHVSVGGDLSQAEWEGIGAHLFNSQATGDMMYASSASQLSRLAIGSTNAFLQVTGGIPAWTTTPTLAGNLAGGAYNITNLTTLSLVTSLVSTVDNSFLRFCGGTTNGSGQIILSGSTSAFNAGGITLRTTNVSSAETDRCTISGQAASAVVTWANCTHSGITLSGNLAGGGYDITNAHVMWGDMYFTDFVCVNCDKSFKKGDKVILEVQEIMENAVRSLPVHLQCSRGE